ncbi:MAG: hypothetical protein GF344_07575 [Chitinivibrionales bacterium]|nr:hypothetical protein [Chitinivibrionales bacterium]MBD3356758.1 hypothetical protein [Chitinivibrionales bacterium]
MRKYLILVIVTVSAAFVALFCLVLILFREDIERQRQLAAERTRETARFAGYLATEHRSAEDKEIDAALASLCNSTGCERIVITDELGLVRWSGNPLISRGDDIVPFLVDQQMFNRSIADTTVALTKIVRLSGSYFQSLYYPFITDSSILMVVVEADRRYLIATDRFRNNMTFVGVGVGLMQVALVGLLLAVGRRARRAAERARTNEHLAYLGRAGAELTHELKNPLAIIKSSVDVLRGKYDPERTEKPFAFVSEEIMRLSRLINSILCFSREKSLRKEPFAPAPLLCKVSERVEHDDSVDFCLRVPETLRLVGDTDAFIQIADNLIRNAEAAAGENPLKITISFEQTDSGATITFDDTGPGIPEKVRRTVFAPFVTGREDGTGLGLAIVKSLCSRMGWEIALSRTGPKGTRFTLTVPKHLWHESS